MLSNNTVFSQNCKLLKSFHQNKIIIITTFQNRAAAIRTEAKEEKDTKKLNDGQSSKIIIVKEHDATEMGGYTSKEQAEAEMTGYYREPVIHEDDDALLTGTTSTSPPQAHIWMRSAAPPQSLKPDSSCSDPPHFYCHLHRLQ